MLSPESNRENREHQKYFWNVIVLQEKKPVIIRSRKPNCKQERYLFCGFVAKLRVLIFAVIGHNTINIPGIFQAFTVSRTQYSV